jgi:hypothetical protein
VSVIRCEYEVGVFSLIALEFDPSAVWSALRHSMESGERRPTMTQRVQRLASRKGLTEDQAVELYFSDGDLEELTKPGRDIPAGLWLVKDDGIYLMSNGTGALAPIYAKGFDPERKAGVWSGASDTVGGDDFEEFLDARMFPEGPYEDSRTRLTVVISSDLIEVNVTFPKIEMPYSDLSFN